MCPDPYIGITDFTDSSQVQTMLEVFQKAFPEANERKLMVGVMMSHKTMNKLESKWLAVFPPAEKVADIFIRHPQLLNTLHYADYDGRDVFRSLTQAAKFGGPNLDALQLDMVWPDPPSVISFKGVYRQLKLVLEINEAAFAKADNSPVRLIRLLHEYAGVLDYVLLDKSMGRGLGLDEKFLRPFIERLTIAAPHFGVAVAGGLGPNSMSLAARLLADYPQLSIDAQGQLRPNGSALEPVDWGIAAEYLRQACSLVR